MPEAKNVKFIDENQVAYGIKQTDNEPHVRLSAHENGDGQIKVVQEGLIDSDNSTSTPLGIDGVFTGNSVDATDYALILLSVYSDQDSATDGLCIDKSHDNITWYCSDQFSIPADTFKTFSFQSDTQYYRVRYTNGGTAQTTFTLQSKLTKTYSKPSSHRIQDSITNEDDAELVKAVVTGKNPSGTFVNFQSTTAGNFKVSLEELENTISSNSNSQLNVTPFHADGTEGALVTGVNYVSGKSGVDAATESLQSIEYEHHEIHSGSHFMHCSYVDLAINNVYDIQITTPNTAEWSHIVFEIISESECLFELYENVTINTAGTTITPLNNNRNSTHASVITMAGISNTSTANANADTAIAGATLLESGIIGTGIKNIGSNTRSREIILKQNEDYTLRMTATAAGYVNFCLQWYEHTNKN